MRSVAIFGSQVTAGGTGVTVVERIEIAGVDVRCGLVHSAPPVFQPERVDQGRQVLVRKRAFSCNFRDRALIHRMAALGPPRGYYPIGSEFVGEVVAVGMDVSDLRPGTRVIADGCYPCNEVDVPPGVATNHASREWEMLPRAKLVPVPDTMPDEVAAAFSIGAQTSYAMLRRANVVAGANVLVTAARSNTALFAIQALLQRGATVYATTTSGAFRAPIEALGVRAVVLLTPSSAPLATNQEIAALARALDGFDCVIDPFFDLHLADVPELLAIGGTYVTCGFASQSQGVVGAGFPFDAASLPRLMLTLLARNLTVIGNTLGESQDLRAALDDHTVGRLPVVVDSIWEGAHIAPFLDRTFNSHERFGKVVFRYD